MGTSGSSNGPGPGVPFDPPWLDDIETPKLGDEQPQDDQGPDDSGLGDGQPELPAERPANPPKVAPSRRFANARRALGNFARTGSKDAFRRALGHYSRTGMGGARSVANRMRTSVRTGASAFGFLQAAREKTNPAINDWVDALTARNASAQEIADEIVRNTTPTGGSTDEAASKESMAQAIKDLLVKYPDINLLNLNDDNIWELIESFLGYEAFHRLSLDIGQVFEDPSISPRTRVTRMREMRDYLRAELSAQVEALRRSKPHATSSQLQSVLQGAIENTFLVYEGAL